MLRTAIAFVALLTACNGPQARRGKGRDLRYPVEVVVVEARRVEYAVHAVGSVEAYERVHVAARVPGAVEQVRFREGDEVRAGQVLAQIDAERYQIAVRSARAVLARTEATEAEAKAGLARREQIVGGRPELIPIEELETYRSRAAAASAQVAEAQAALQTAELNLKQAFPVAPVAGIVESRSVETGQYVQPGAAITTLVRRDPLLLRFQVPEREARSLARGSVVTFTVGTPESLPARITHVAQSADASSRLVSVTAEIDDPRRAALRPGSFAEVTVVLGARDSAAVVPQMAIRPSERGFLAFVVEGDVARERILETGMRTPDGLVEVKSGLTAGERLVVRGAEALSDGYPVNARGAPAPAAPAGGGDPSRGPGARPNKDAAP
jgi:multidrug efflux system membrane fusion protein